MSIKIFIAVILCCTAGYCADQAWFRLTGFSSNGRYLMWETGGVHDGSGFPWISMEVLDLTDGRQVAEFSRVWEDSECSDPDFTIADSAGKELCLAFDIQRENWQEPIVYYPVTDLSNPRDTTSFCLEMYCPEYNSGELKLVVSSEPGKPGEGYPDWFPPPAHLTVELGNDEKFFVLFSEETLSEKYSLFFSYELAGIWRNPFNSSSLLILLHGKTPGFEGASGRYRAVAALLPEKI